jgi:arginase
VGAPDIICGAFKGALAGDLINAWLDLGEIPDHQAEIEIFPRKVQTKSTKGGFKYEEHYIRNLPGLCGSVRKVLEGGRMPVIIGGDHSIAFGTQGTINDYFYEKTGKSIGLIWIDAHADINTAHTTESGNLHGGPVAGLLGYIKYLSKYFKHVILPQNLVYIAMRDPDRPEIKIIQQRGIRVITVDEIKEIGVKKVMEEARRIAAKGTAGISVSFDIDAFDKELVPGTGTPVKNGLTREMGQAICRSLSRWEELLAFELVEINPAKDVREKTINLGTKVLLEVLINLEHSDDLKKFAEAGSAEIKSAAAEYLNKLEHPPKELDLSFKNITDAGLVYILSLQDLSQLRFVDLSHTRVGNKGLSRLARIITPKLIEVSISETEITPAGKMDFQNAKPKVKITGK